MGISRKIFIALMSITVAVAFCVVPDSAAFAYTYSYSDESSSDDYQYVDENGQIIEDDAVEDDAVNTDWFDSEDIKDEYHIKTRAQLLGFASLVNEEQWYWKENAHETFEGVRIVLDRDITLNQEWEPVGDSERVSFAGTFDGNGHTISGLKMNTNAIYVGFFGYLSGRVENLTLEGRIVSTNGPCGAFAGYADSDARIVNCKSEVTVKGRAKSGGIAAFNDGGRIEKCTNLGSVSGTKNVGGVAGENWGTIKKSGNHGSIKSTARGAGTFGTGGVAGRTVNRKALDRCFNTGNISSANEGTGGVAGYTTSAGTKITNSYNTGDIKVVNTIHHGDNSYGYAGGIAGIVGVKGVVIENCYSSGKIQNTDVTGGIIGEYLNESEESGDRYVNNNIYANVSAKGVGRDFEGHQTNIAGGTKKTGASSLTNEAGSLGQAFENESEGKYGNDGYPILKWQANHKESTGVKEGRTKYVGSFKPDHEVIVPGQTVLELFNPFIFVESAVAKKEKPGDYLKKARAAQNIKPAAKETDAGDTAVDITYKERVRKAIAPVKKQFDAYESSHPQNSRKGSVILKLFAPAKTDLTLKDIYWEVIR